MLSNMCLIHCTPVCVCVCVGGNNMGSNFFGAQWVLHCGDVGSAPTHCYRSTIDPHPTLSHTTIGQNNISVERAKRDKRPVAGRRYPGHILGVGSTCWAGGSIRPRPVLLAAPPCPRIHCGPLSPTLQSRRGSMSGGGSRFLVQEEGTAGHSQRVISPRVTTEQAMAQRNDAASLHGNYQIKVERRDGGCRRLGSRHALTSIHLNGPCPSTWPFWVGHPQNSMATHYVRPTTTYLSSCPFAGYRGKPRYQACNRSRAAPGVLMMNRPSMLSCC